MARGDYIKVRVDCGGGVTEPVEITAERAGGQVRQTVKAGNKTRPAELIVEELSISGKVVRLAAFRLDRVIFRDEHITERVEAAKSPVPAAAQLALGEAAE